MKQGHYILLAALPLIAFGCASANVNPSVPRANTGYVDFYSPTDAELCWDVGQSRTSTVDFSTVFRDVKPVEGDVLRLAFASGRQRFRVTFLNRVVVRPAEVEVQIENGKITPIRVALVEAGPTSVQSKQTSRGNTFYGRAGRRTKITSDETVIYEISAMAEAAVPYQTKEQMPYAR